MKSPSDTYPNVFLGALAISGVTLFVADEDSKTVSSYLVPVGGSIHLDFIGVAHGPGALAVSGNTLFVAHGNASDAC